MMLTIIFEILMPCTAFLLGIAVVVCNKELLFGSGSVIVDGFTLAILHKENGSIDHPFRSGVFPFYLSRTDACADLIRRKQQLGNDPCGKTELIVVDSVVVLKRP